MLALTFMVALLGTARGTAEARSSYLTSFNTKYGTSGTKLNSCNTCHGSGGTSTFNPFGQGIVDRIGQGIDAALTAVEPLDSDGDGFTNIAEINARTFPGDAADFPAASDTTPPAVNGTSPVNGAMAVPATANVTATFSEAVQNVSATTFLLRAGTTSVAGTVTLAGTTATFDPAQPLVAGTTYTATVTTGVTDLANNALGANHAWSFTTATAADTMPPAVSATSPMQGDMNVAINGMVTATFSEAVKNVTGSTFTLRAGAVAVPGTVTLSGMMATFRPSQPLANSTTYTATVTTGVTDLANNALPASHTWSFTTGAAADTTPPAVSATTPGSGDSAVPVSADLTVTFSEPMDPATLTTATFTLQAAGGAPVSGVVTADGTTATFNPGASLADGVSYTATVTTAAEDQAGNALAASYSWTFTASAAAAPPPAPETVDSAGGGCSVASRTGGGPADLAGAYGLLVLTAALLGVRSVARRFRGR